MSPNAPETHNGKVLARGYLVLCLALLPLVVFFVLVRPWAQTADFWETAATVRAVSQNFFHPDNPLLALPGDTSPRFTPFTLWWGAVMKSGLNVFAVMALAGIANYLLFVTGLFRFVRGEFRSLTLPIYVLITMLIVWGTGYGQANGYQLRIFLEQLPYVGFFTYGICFHALVFLRRYLIGKRWEDLVWYAALMIVAFLTHPITAAFGFATAVAVLAAEKNWHQLILMQAIPLLSVAVSLVWPYFDYWSVLTRGSSEAWFDAPLFRNQVEALGPALIGIPIAVYFAIKKRHLMVVYGLTFCAAIYAAAYFLQILIGSRFLFYATIFLHLAIAIYLYEHAIHRRRTLDAWLHGHGYLLIIVFMLFVPSLWYRAHEMAKHLHRFYRPPLHFQTYKSPARDFFFLENQLDASNVVMAEDTTGWVVPAISGAKIVSPQKGDPLITGEVTARRASTKAFFTEQIPTRGRLAILRHYHVTHVLLNEAQREQWDESFLQDLGQISSPQARSGPIVLYRISI